MDDSFLDEEVQDDKLYVPLEVQRAILQQNVSKVRKERGVKREAEEDAAVQPEKKSLVQRNMERLRAQEEQGVTADEVREQEEEAARVQFEADIEAADLHEGRQLMSAHDVAHGVSYKERLRCTWTAPQHVRDMDEETRDYIRKQRNIIVEGTDVPNPCLSFADFKLPRELLASLSERGMYFFFFKRINVSLYVLVSHERDYPITLTPFSAEGTAPFTPPSKNRCYKLVFCFCRRTERLRVPPFLYFIPFPFSFRSTYSLTGITQPTPIQQQGIPAVLSNRDVIGCAFTGSGKTMVFLIPMLMKCLSEERMMPLQRGEGPICLAMAPMRELAMQHYDIFCDYATALRQKRVADIRAFPAIGGSKRSDGEAALRNGCHACFATPGRLKDCLEKKTINFDICTFVCLDEADRMIDVGTEEEVREVYQHFKHQRQTVMFSATMPKKIKQFALTSLVDPITVNANRAGAANMDVRQEVEYVEREHKLINLLECLQKTQPPVLIFAEGKHDVDFVHEYLLLKLVSVCPFFRSYPTFQIGAFFFWFDIDKIDPPRVGLLQGVATLCFNYPCIVD